jgi:hypothetical protein
VADEKKNLQIWWIGWLVLKAMAGRVAETQN